jgi:hypothetical protein
MSYSPRNVESRKKIYAQEIKDKNIYGRMIEVRCSGLKTESTKSKIYKKESIEAIPGVKKDI